MTMPLTNSKACNAISLKFSLSMAPIGHPYLHIAVHHNVLATVNESDPLPVKHDQ